MVVRLKGKRKVGGDAGSSRGTPRRVAMTISGAPLEGRRVLLRPVGVSDHAWLYLLSTHEENAFRWRYRGDTPSPEVFLRSLWDQVLVQLVVEERSTKQPVGLVVAYGADFQNSHVQVAVLLDPSVQRQAWPHEAVILFVNYLFINWNLRKLYAEALGFNYQQFASGAGRIFRVEAKLREYHYWDGRYWDKFIFACTREDWDGLRARFLRFALPQQH